MLIKNLSASQQEKVNGLLVVVEDEAIRPATLIVAQYFPLGILKTNHFSYYVQLFIIINTPDFLL